MAASKSVSSKQIVKAEINGSEIAITKGTANFSKQKNDATGSTSGGWLEFTVGNRGLTFTIEGQVKKDAPQRVLSDTAAITIPGDPDNELVSFKLYFADSTGVTGLAIMEASLSGDPQGGSNVGWTINGTASGPVTTF